MCGSAAIERNHAAILIKGAALLRKCDRYAPSQRHITLISQQRLASLYKQPAGDVEQPACMVKLGPRKLSL